MIWTTKYFESDFYSNLTINRNFLRGVSEWDWFFKATMNSDILNNLLQSACTSMCRHEYNWNIVEYDLKQPLHTPRRPSGAPLRDLSEFYGVPVDFVHPPKFERCVVSFPVAKEWLSSISRDWPCSSITYIGSFDWLSRIELIHFSKSHWRKILKTMTVSRQCSARYHLLGNFRILRLTASQIFSIRFKLVDGIPNMFYLV